MDVSEPAKVGKNTKIRHQAQIIGKNVYIDHSVKIADNCSVCFGVEIEDGVFIGPHVCFTNDRNPRAIESDASLKDADDWENSWGSLEWDVIFR